MIISKPELPPAPQGYVEDINEDGAHYYRKTDKQVEKEAQVTQLQALTANPNVLTRLTALESAMTTQMGV